MKRAVKPIFVLPLAQAGVWAQSYLESPPASGQAPTESIRARVNEAATLLKRHAPADALKPLQALLVEVGSTGDRTVLVEVLFHTGTGYFQHNDYQQSLKHYQRALEPSRALHNRFFEAETSRGIAQVYKNIGAYADSLNSSERALAVYYASGDRQVVARTWVTMGSVWDLMGDYRQALEYSRKAQPVFEELKDSTLYRSLNEIGVTLKNLGRYREALDSYALALEGSRGANDKYFQAVILNNIRVAYEPLGQDERAIESYDQSLALAREMGERRGQSILLNNLGESYKALGDNWRARLSPEGTSDRAPNRQPP
ncbi:MAG TPA: tetratricopeptide repeat protein [Blastocatellia bacterium]|nr:tetratricopeptide repeat protein [Blastocatellia bacterium]